MSTEIIGGSSEKKAPNKVIIPEPRPEDLTWAKKLKKLSSEKLNGELYRSAFKGNLWQVNHLLTYSHKNWAMKNQKADIHYESDWALSRASMGEHLDVMQLLINNGCDPCNQDQLRKAVNEGKLKSIQLLMDCGSDRNVPRFVNNCIANENLETLKFLFSKHTYTEQDMNQFFATATNDSNLEVVKYLYENFNIDLNANDGRAVSNAFLKSKSDVAEYLVENGAKLFPDADLRMRSGIENGYLWKTRLFVNMGIKVEQSMIDCALECKKHEIVDFLKKELQISSNEKAAEEYPKWEKIDKESIAYVSLAGADTFSCIRTVFNFKSRRVLEFSENPVTKALSAPLATNFLDFEGTSMLNEAEDILKKEGGKPTPYIGAKHVDKNKVYKHQVSEKRQTL